MFENLSKKKLLNITIFQVGWFVCIFSGSLWAICFTLLVLVIHGVFFVKNSREWMVILLFSSLGISIDSTLIYFELLKATSPIIPLWLVCLWVLLSLTLCHGLQWLQNRLLLSAVAAAVIGPWSYWAGSQFVDIQLTTLPTSLPVLALLWALVMPLGLYLARRLCFKPVDGRKSSKNTLVLLLVLALINASGLVFLPFSHLVNAEPIDQRFMGEDTIDTGIVEVVGTAYDFKGKRILYKEIHTLINPLNRHVLYISPQSKTIAQKNINYENSLISPTYTQENYWAHEKTHANWGKNQLYLSFSHLSNPVNKVPNTKAVIETQKKREGLLLKAL